MPIATTLGLAYGAHPRQQIDVFVPEGATAALCLCLDGGWWADGRSRAGRGFALLLAERGCAVATVGHRPLGDGARNGDDVLADLAEGGLKALEEAQVLGFAGRSLAILGHGSGSLPALLLAPRFAGKAVVRAVVACGVLASLEPGAGTAAAHQSACDRFAGGRHNQLSPLHADPAAIPPLLILHGDADRDVPHAQAQALHRRMADAGEVCRLETIAGAGHRFAEDALAAHAEAAAAMVAAYLAEHACEPQAGEWSFGYKV